MKIVLFIRCLVLLCIISLVSCTDNQESLEDSSMKTEVTSGDISLHNLSSSETGVDFNNEIVETNLINFKTDEYIYNGAGVAIVDINNDGLSDLFFSGNQVENRLYLNKGDFKFEDISEHAGIQLGGWSNGVSIVDLNNDGWMDIYVCRGGSLEKDERNRANHLFINNKDLTFSELGKQYGVDDTGYSLGAVFLDYDKDEDLDLFITNYPIQFRASMQQIQSMSANPPEEMRDKLYRNNGNFKFEEIGKQAGVVTKAGHGLGVGVADLNGDSYPDIYVSNDYITDDFYYLNQRDGTFKEVIRSAIKHTAQFSMGLDLADVNNDLLPDVVAVDMTPEDNFRSKTNMASMNPEKYNRWIEQGMHPQVMRNVLQLNMGNNMFSEIGQMAGIDKTDWSWSVLANDLDNDGLKDLYISNGYLRDVLDKDTKHLAETTTEKSTWLEFVEKIPSVKISNYVFQNKDGMHFEKANNKWNLDGKSFSNGVSMGDLDNDGDLDIVVSNINDPAFIIENKANKTESNNYIRFAIKGPDKNLSGYGTSVTITVNGEEQIQSLYAYRGYLSSVEPILHFGLGKAQTIDKVEVSWPNGQITTINDVKSNQQMTLSFSDMEKAIKNDNSENQNYFREISQLMNFNYTHQENNFDDYASQILLPHKMSHYGPRVTVSDVNNDGYDDFFISAAAGKSSILYMQTADMQFQPARSQPWRTFANAENMDALFFDADGDGDKDLYLVSGGFETPEADPLLQDQLYINDGGTFTNRSELLPEMKHATANVSANDYDGDGDLDLFVGGRTVPNKYPMAEPSFLLKNEGGKFVDASPESFSDLGIVSASFWNDFNQDGNKELFVAGEWMSIRVYSFQNGQIEEISADLGLENTSGWWFSMKPSDIDNDGDIDFVAGNLGKNYKYRVKDGKPFEVYAKDFDDNGSFDIVLGYHQADELFPVRGLQCSSEQMPFVKKEFPTYNQFASANLNEIYGDRLDDAIHYETNTFENVWFENDNGKFIKHTLPNLAQIAPIFGMLIEDFSGNGHKDILIAGNLFTAEVETGNADAGYGLLLEGQSDKSFLPKRYNETGFIAPFDVRDMDMVKSPSGKNIALVANNRNRLQVFAFNLK